MDLRQLQSFISVIEEGSLCAASKRCHISQPALSQQLAELRRAELVKTRREAKQVHYRLADDAAALCVRTLEAMFGADDLSAPQTAPALRQVRPRETPSVVRPQNIGAAVFARVG